ncbi:hypothetical protein ABFA07_020253 [Porites harrisoni]
MKKHLITVLFALLAITFLVGEVEGLTSQLPPRGKLKLRRESSSICQMAKSLGCDADLKQNVFESDLHD